MVGENVCSLGLVCWRFTCTLNSGAPAVYIRQWNNAPTCSDCSKQDFQGKMPSMLTHPAGQHRLQFFSDCFYRYLVFVVQRDQEFSKKLYFRKRWLCCICTKVLLQRENVSKSLELPSGLEPRAGLQLIVRHLSSAGAASSGAWGYKWEWQKYMMT